ncbi:TonB-dependent receptor plug domain-containing protein [Parahaliea aestuarii]|uniref:TonB-dependent receptor n=1 Tax=Parahaliea aestuarii TaxID=1852021 RepID=A0A5C8ZUY1_9GAMM|nr:TonB-dependent receptor [Parahaliea aestuarii]TXS91629.1 TonB-dependent receptor [Parahaliea aestuarii]
MTPRNLSLAVAAASGLAAIPASASTDTRLEELLVVDQKLEESIPLTLERYGNQVEVITAETIRQHSFVDVSDALKTLVPGLHMSPKNGPFDYFSASLQGARNKDILWLVDGVRINNRLYNNTSPLDTLPPHMIERVEVLKGGQGIFYGTQSVSGVVNIVSKDFSEEIGGAVGGGINSNDGSNLNGYARGALGAHQFVVYASQDHADGYTPFDDDAIQSSVTDTDRSYNVKSAGLKYAYNLSDDTRVSAMYQYTDADLDFARPALNKKTTNHREEGLTTLKLDSRLSDYAQLYFKGYLHEWDTYYTRIYNELDDNGNLTGGEVVLNDDAYWGYEDYGFNAMVELDFDGNFEYVLGFDQQNYSGVDEVWRIADQEETVNAVFAQLRTSEKLFENSLFALGVRNNRPSDADQSTVWNLTGKHDFSGGWYVQGNVGTSFRLPDAEELFLNEYYDLDGDGVPDNGWFAIGNPELEAEESENLNLSVGASFERFQFELTGFRRDVSNYISAYVPVTIGGVTGETFENSRDEVNIEGAELQTNWQMTDSLRGQFSYTWTGARLNDDGEQLNDIPERESKLSLNYRQPGSPWGLNFTTVHVGEINDRETRDSYTVADISGFLTLGSDQQHQLTLRLENIADAEYATDIGTANEDATGNSYLYRSLGMERTLHLGYSYRF